MGFSGAIGGRIAPDLAHVHHLGEHGLGWLQLWHGHGDRSQPDNLPLGRHRRFGPGDDLVGPIDDHAEALAFKILEIERELTVALLDG
jgi:hypothetical protein